MARIFKKFIRPDAVDGSKIKLLNDEALRASAADGSNVISILKVNSSDIPEFLTLPIASVDPTQAEHLARKGYVDQKIADLVDSAPAVLDTLKELADALGSDPNFATTIAGQIGAIETRLDVLEGTGAGSVAKALVDAKAYTDQEVALDRARLTTLEASVADQSALDALAGRVTTAEGDIATLKGDANTVGSVAKAQADAQSYADSLNSALDSRLDTLEGGSSVVGSVAKAQADAQAYADSLNSALDSRLDTLEGDATVAGSVAKAQADAQSHANSLDAAMDTRVAAIEALSFHKQKITIGLSDVMAGYVDLAHEAIANSTFLFVQGGGFLYEGDDYSLSVVGGVSRITFAGDFASGGVTAIADGDVLAVQFQYSSGAGGGGNSGGGGGASPTISIMSHMDNGMSYQVYWNATDASSKFVQLQKFDGMSWSTVQNLGAVSLGYGSAMTMLLNNGDQIRLRLFDDSMFMTPTSPEVVSSSVTVSKAATPPPPSPASLYLMSTSVNGSDVTISYSASNAMAYPYLGLYEVAGMSYIFVADIGATNMGNQAIVSLSLFDPAKTYKIAASAMQQSSLPDIIAITPIQIAEGTGGAPALNPQILTASFDLSVDGKLTWTVNGDVTDEQVKLQAYAMGQYSTYTAGLAAASAGTVTIDPATYGINTSGSYKLILSKNGADYGASPAFTYTAPAPSFGASTLTYQGFGNTGYWDMQVVNGAYTRAGRFVASSTARLDKVSINIRSVNNGNTESESVVLTLHTASGNALSAAIATATVPMSNVSVHGVGGADTYVDFEFDEAAVELTSGTTYWVRVNATANGQNLYLPWYHQDDIPGNLAGSITLRMDAINSGSTITQENHTFAMKIYTKTYS